MKDTGLLGDGHGSIEVVAGDHADEDAGLLARGDGLDDIRPQRIGDADEGVQAHVLLQLFRALSDGAAGHIDGRIDVVPVTERHAAKGRGGIVLDRRLDFRSLGRRQLPGRSVRVQVRAAVLQDGLGRTLVVQRPAHPAVAGGGDARAAVAVFGPQTAPAGRAGSRPSRRRAADGLVDNDRHPLPQRAEGEQAGSAALAELRRGPAGGVVVPVPEGRHRQGQEGGLGLVADEDGTVVVNQSVGIVVLVRDLGRNDPGRRAGGDALKDDLQGRGGYIGGCGGEVVGRPICVLNCPCVGEPPPDDRHAVLRQRPRLVAADVGGVAHGLARVEVADEVLVGQHLLGGVGQTDGDGEGQSFGDGDDDDGDADDEGVEGEVEHRHVVQVRRPDDQLDDQHGGEGGQRGRDADVADEGGHGVELLLQRGLLLLLLEVGLDDAPLRVPADGRGDVGAGAGAGGAPAQDEGIAVEVLVDVDGLPGQRALVQLEAVAAQEDAVAGDLIPGLDADDVADDDVADGDLPRGAAVAQDDGVDVVIFFRERCELPLLLVVVEGRDDGDDEDGREDGDALDVSRGGIVCAGHV